MRPGEYVRDSKNPEWGFGQVTNIANRSEPIIYVKFEKVGERRYMAHTAGTSLRSLKKETAHIISLLKEYKFLEADQLFDEERTYISRNWYEDQKQTYQNAARERRQKEEAESQRIVLLKKLRRRFRSDFLSTDSFFQESCAGSITEQDYEKEKFSFVKRWISENTPSAMDKTKRIPDDEQIAAIASVHGHIQVVARAGSGKTSTLVNRTLFLLKHCGVAPSEIIILAFNRRSALEVRRRLLTLLEEGADKAISNRIDYQVRKQGKSQDINKIEDDAVDAVAQHLNVTLPYVMTFHALAYRVVHPEEDLLYNDAESEKLNQTVQQVIDDHRQLPAFNDKIRRLMLAHFREDWDRILQGRYDQSSEEFLRFRRSLQQRSINGDYVKSYGEKVIANFLFEHDIPYKYEKNHWWDGTNYRPDFTIETAPKSGVIIEYFGLKGNVDYDKMSEEKRSYWDSKDDWTLIEFTSSDITAQGVDSFNQRLKTCLENQGIQCVRLSEDEIWHLIKDREIDQFTRTLQIFIARCRKQSLSHTSLRGSIDNYSPLSSVESMFLDLAYHLYTAYLDRLSATGKEDFDGLMQRAAEEINSGQVVFKRKSESGNLATLRYICIDEFQDFSDLFYRLLTAIRKQNPSVELFCVGDDWQAINGFAGSDLQFFNNFEQYVGESRRLDISTNYRSLPKIVSVGNELMKGRGKPAKAIKESSGGVHVLDLNDFVPSVIEKDRYGRDRMTPAVSRLANEALVDDKDVVMLCRTHMLPGAVNSIRNDKDELTAYLGLVRSLFPKSLKERISISTTHKYKGLEGSMVIVLDALEYSYPLIHPNWIFSRIFGDSLKKIIDEERRLLYVALTRAVDTLVIITEGHRKSPFLEELEHSLHLSKINWADYPSVRGPVTRLVVKVGNQERWGGTPTFAIKDLLKATGYQWQPTDWPGWVKSFPAKGFDLDALKSEIWAARANGIEVRIFDDTEDLVARFLINTGKWNCTVNQLNVICTPPEEPNTAINST